jgi:uncharacterized protein YraI
MFRKSILISISTGLVLLLFMMLNFQGVKAQDIIMQQPTGSVPTVTGTPKGVIATVNLNQEESINVRSGPGTLYDEVGILLPGQSAAVKGRTSGGDWLLIDYAGAPNGQGWIYEALVTLSPGEVQIVEVPPTVTPVMTQTINPTLAAQFIKTPVPTRLATYTPVDPLIIATYEDKTRTSILGGIPMGLVILSLAVLGGILSLVSVIRGR